MKLFTKDIDNKLFNQYPLGNDLEKQMVVAKIFNAYGKGVWYIINSDPQDPDYLWAIVDLFEVEIGSVSRSELETLRVPPFGLGLERDLYWKPMNAAEVFKGLLRGEKYADGGEIGQPDWLFIGTYPNAIIYSDKRKSEGGYYHEIGRVVFAPFGVKIYDESPEYRSVVDMIYAEAKDIEAKGEVEVSATGQKANIYKYAGGGGVKERVYIEYLNKEKNFQRDKKYFDSYEDAKNWAVQNFDNFHPDMVHYEYAKGGMATFDDKVKAISGSLEGKRVKPKYQRRYGKLYDKKEAKEAATKIAGAMRAKERVRSILNKRKKS